jgi:type II secretory pathway component GspD/PulD (secretin)
VRPVIDRVGSITPVLLLALFLVCLIPPAARAQVKTESSLISLDADSISINAVLQTLAQRSGLNIVTSPEVHGRKMSIHLRETPFTEALNLVVRMAGLGYERVGGSILVAEPKTLEAQTGLVTKVFDLQYANPVEVRDLLQVVSKEVGASPNSNRVSVRGSQATIDEVTEIIRQLDQKPAQILLEARMIEVNTTALLEVGIDWEKITKWSTVVTEGYQGRSAIGSAPQAIDFTKINESSELYRQQAAFQVALDALITQGQARLLSNTKVVTLEGRPAEIFAGETVPVVITSLQNPGSSGGLLQTVQLEKIDVGVKLQITPRIADGGFITTLVEPEVSRIEAFLGPNSDLPETSERRAKTLVRVHDGEKIYLGGLLTDEHRKTIKKIPLLGDIPYLGRLFRHYRDENVKLDLVIEITPKIVGDQGAVVPSAPDPGGKGQ